MIRVHSYIYKISHRPNIVSSLMLRVTVVTMMSYIHECYCVVLPIVGHSKSFHKHDNIVTSKLPLINGNIRTN